MWSLERTNSWKFSGWRITSRRARPSGTAQPKSKSFCYGLSPKGSYAGILVPRVLSCRHFKRWGLVGCDRPCRKINTFKWECILILRADWAPPLNLSCFLLTTWSLFHVQSWIVIPSFMRTLLDVGRFWYYVFESPELWVKQIYFLYKISTSSILLQDTKQTNTPPNIPFTMSWLCLLWALNKWNHTGVHYLSAIVWVLNVLSGSCMVLWFGC